MVCRREKCLKCEEETNQKAYHMKLYPEESDAVLRNLRKGMVYGYSPSFALHDTQTVWQCEKCGYQNPNDPANVIDRHVAHFLSGRRKMSN